VTFKEKLENILRIVKQERTAEENIAVRSMSTDQYAYSNGKAVAYNHVSELISHLIKEIN